MGVSSPRIKPPKPPPPPPPPPSYGDNRGASAGFFLKPAKNAGFKGTAFAGRSIFKGWDQPTRTASNILRGS